MRTFTELLPLFPKNQTILDTVAKTLDHIEDGKKIMVSVQVSEHKPEQLKMGALAYAPTKRR